MASENEKAELHKAIWGIAGIVARKQELCDQIQAAIDQLVENGTYQKIADKYPDIVNNLIFLNK